MSFKKQHCQTPIVAVFLILAMIAFLSCGSKDTSSHPSHATIVVHHQNEEDPIDWDHIHYSGYDIYGNRIYTSSEYFSSDFHTLSDVPKDVAEIVIEYHTDTEEKLSKSIHAVFLSNGYFNLHAAYDRPHFNPNRVAIVDDFEGNLLVRGNLPLVITDPDDPDSEYRFAYAELKTKMEGKIPGFKIEDYEIIDFALIDNRVSGNKQMTALIKALGMEGLGSIHCGDHWYPFQGCDWEPAEIYWSTAVDKKLAGLVWWPVWACPSIPCMGDEIDTALDPKQFNFIDASAFLNELLTTKSESGKKRLIYFHCVQGTDRTGALHIAYILDKNPDLTFQEAIGRAKIGAKQVSQGEPVEPQLDPELVPSCTYVGQAFQYCQRQNESNLARCDMPAEFTSRPELCR
jgi:hypothetical protein